LIRKEAKFEEVRLDAVLDPPQALLIRNVPEYKHGGQTGQDGDHDQAVHGAGISEGPEDQVEYAVNQPQ
jgi:hypothetical protein